MKAEIYRPGKKVLILYWSDGGGGGGKGFSLANRFSESGTTPFFDIILLHPFIGKSNYPPILPLRQCRSIGLMVRRLS